VKAPGSSFTAWSDTPLPLEAIAGSPVSIKAQALTAGTGIPFDATLLLTMMTAVAAVGPARYVYNPLGGCTVPVSVNVILIAEPSALLSGVARGEFVGFHKLIQAEVRRAGHEDSRRRGEDILQARLQLLMAEDILSGRRTPKIDLGPLSERDPEIAAEYTARAMPHALKETKQLKEKLETTLVGLTMASCPYLVADGLGVEELCAPERISFDSALLNLSFAGETLRALRGASPQKLVQLGRVMAASWAGTTPFSLSAARPHRPMLSNLLLCGREEARAFLECQTLIDHGISPLFIALEAQAITPADPSALADAAGWCAHIESLLTSRFVGDQVEHRLSEGAATAFMEFVQAVDTLMPVIPPQSQCSAKHWPDLALKIALLVDVGSFDLRPPETKEEGQPTAGAAQREPVSASSRIISEATVRFAVALTKRIAGAQMCLLAASDGPGQGAVQPDREVEKMRDKLKLHGPMTWHNLLRKYNRQKNDLWAPVLLRGLASGRIVQEGNILSAADFAVSKTVSGSTASSSSDGDFCATSDSGNPQSKNGV